MGTWETSHGGVALQIMRATTATVRAIIETLLSCLDMDPLRAETCRIAAKRGRGALERARTGTGRGRPDPATGKVPR